MDLQKSLIESKKRIQKGMGKASLFSVAVHAILIAAIVFVGMTGETFSAGIPRRLRGSE